MSSVTTTPMATLSGVLVFALMVMTIVDVASREWTGTSAVPGVVEISEVVLVCSIFLAFPIAERTGVHMRTSVLTIRLSPRPRRYYRGAMWIVGVAILSVMIWVSASITVDSIVAGEHRFGLLNVPIWPARAAIVLGLSAYLFEYIRGGLKRWADKSPAQVGEDAAFERAESAEEGGQQ